MTTAACPVADAGRSRTTHRLARNPQAWHGLDPADEDGALQAVCAISRLEATRELTGHLARTHWLPADPDDRRSFAMLLSDHLADHRSLLAHLRGIPTHDEQDLS